MINHYIKEGLIVPAEVTVGLLRAAMDKSHGNRFLVDGFPRDMDNLNCWKNTMSNCAEINFVLFLDCPNEIMIERLLHRCSSLLYLHSITPLHCIHGYICLSACCRGETSGRSDDNRESIVKRFKTYDESTRPIIDYFRSINKVRIVYSNRDPALVFADVAKLFRKDIIVPAATK